MKIFIFQLTGEYAMDSRIGQELFDRVSTALNQGESVELDFTGVRVFSLPFFSYGIAQLLRDYDRQLLNDRIKILNLADWGKNVLEQVLKNARQFYGIDDASVSDEVRL